MKVEREEKNHRGAFYIEKDGDWVAEMTYAMTGDHKMIINHTEVATELQGKNIGMELVSAGVAYAREYHIKIIPLCPYAKSVFARVDAFKDVLA